MKMWKNGAQASEVKNAIDYNFNLLDNRTRGAVRIVTTAERGMMEDSYLRKGAVVFDLDVGSWLEYDGKNWVPFRFPTATFKCVFLLEDWGEDASLFIPYSTHGIDAPCVRVFVSESGGYSEVIGCGVLVDSNNNVTIKTNSPFACKVVIK